MAYGSVLAFTEDAATVTEDVVQRAGAGFGLSLIIMPMVFMGAAFVSKRQDWPVMTIAAMGLALAVGLPSLVMRNPVASLITGYAAGAVVSLSVPEGLGLRPRIYAAAIVAAIVHFGMWALPAPTAWIAPALPFTAMGIADAFGRPAQEDEQPA